MSSVTPINTAKVASCPHGMPAGACPICNGSGGGGGMKTQRPNPHPEQTMSITAMYAVLNRMKAADAKKEAKQAELLKQAENLQKTKEVLIKTMDKLSAVLNKIENILPKPIVNIFHTVVTNVLKPIVEIIQKFPEAVKNFNEFLQNVKTQMFIAGEKLASIFGEIKNFIQKNISDSFKKFTKKVHKILNIFRLNSDDDYEEEEKVNAEMYIFKNQDMRTLKEFMTDLIAKKQIEEKENDNINN